MSSLNCIQVDLIKSMEKFSVLIKIYFISNCTPIFLGCANLAKFLCDRTASLQARGTAGSGHQISVWLFQTYHCSSLPGLPVFLQLLFLFVMNIHCFQLSLNWIIQFQMHQNCGLFGICGNLIQSLGFCSINT
jgi:hypothetical protein